MPAAAARDITWSGVSSVAKSISAESRGNAEQRVAHDAADGARAAGGAIEQREDLLRLVALEPVGGGEASLGFGARHHGSSPVSARSRKRRVRLAVMPQMRKPP